MDAAQKIAAIELPDSTGTLHRLGDLWSQRPVALVWLRHYGWIYCRAHALQLQGAWEEFRAAGADVVLIGQATPADAESFRRQFDLELTVLADERRVSYKAVGAPMAGIGGLLGPRVVLRGLMTIFGRRVRQGKTIGHPAQLGAALVIAPGGRILFEQRARDASDNAPPEALLAALPEPQTV